MYKMFFFLDTAHDTKTGKQAFLVPETCLMLWIWKQRAANKGLFCDYQTQTSSNDTHNYTSLGKLVPP